MESINFTLTHSQITLILIVLILGLAGYLLMKRFQHQPNTGLKEQRRLQILEDVSTQVGTVTHIFSQYSTLVVESIQLGDRWPAARRQELDVINNELVAEFKKLAEAEARLLMIGEKNLERSLRLYGAKIAIYRKQVFVGRKDITPEQITSLKSAIHQVREQFYDMLSRKYDRLLASA
jgi:flagellar biogenesis protein FliO